MARTIYVSGNFCRDEDATVNVLDHGLLYGDGVFEGIRAYNGRVFKLDRHIDRLFESAKALRLTTALAPRDRAHRARDLPAERDHRRLHSPGHHSRRRRPGIDPSSCRNPEVIVIARPVISFYREPSRHQARDIVAQAAVAGHPDPVDQVAELREQRAGADGSQRSRR